MAVAEGLSRIMRSRASGRCRYCLMHESLQGATFHIEHVIPQSKGGKSSLENLTLACPGCNLHKADRSMTIPSNLCPKDVFLSFLRAVTY
jgi:5-methylcytosine-specific restriction endonuclease McrA